MYKIRAAQADDYSAISQLNLIKENMQLDVNDSIIEEDFYYESLQEPDSKWFLVEKSGEIKAFTFFTVDRVNKVIEINKFTVSHNDRKKGLNEHLYKKIEQLASVNEITSIKVEISEDHMDVIDFFERKSLTKVKKVPN